MKPFPCKLKLEDKGNMKAQKVAAIIPAFNEEKTIRQVIETLLKVPTISEVIVVDDGSTDKTFEVAKTTQAKVIKLKENKGKGEALQVGVEATDASILLFVDADLIGITPSHFEQLINPILKGNADMCIGAIDRRAFKKIWVWILERMGPLFAGTRAFKKEFWYSIPKKYKKGYFVESALTYFAKKNNLKIYWCILKGVTHIIKEKKYGVLFGTFARAKMFLQIIIANILLRFS